MNTIKLLLILYGMIVVWDTFISFKMKGKTSLTMMDIFLKMQLTHILQFNFILAILFVGFPLMIRGILFPKTIFKNWFLVSRALLFALGMRINVIGSLPETDKFVAVANHASFLDIFLTARYFGGTKKGIVFLHKKLLHFPLLGWWLRKLDSIPVVPGKNKSLTKEEKQINFTAIKKSITALSSGIALIIFPEGTRTNDGGIKPFEEGAFVLAKKTDAPVVPIAFIGAYDAKPKWRPWINPQTITIYIGKPIDGQNLSVPDFVNNTHRMIVQLMSQ